MVQHPRPRRRHQGPPTVGMPERSDRPLERSPRVAESVKSQVEGPRCIAVFGPKAGCTTMTHAIAETAETPTAVIDANDLDADDIIEAVDEALKRSEVVFIDGAPRTPEEARALIDARVIDPATHGAFIRVWAPDLALIDRGMTKDDIAAWKMKAEAIERVIFSMVPSSYYMIPNQPETGLEELLIAVGQLARRARIRR